MKHINCGRENELVSELESVIATDRSHPFSGLHGLTHLIEVEVPLKPAQIAEFIWDAE
jgi:hypothetical protein